MAAGYGGIAAVAAATGIAPSTIGRGIEELSLGGDRLPGRVRRPGGGLLEGLDYSLQATAKPKGSSHPDRDTQFRYVNNQVAEGRRRREYLAHRLDLLWAKGRLPSSASILA
jgi:hypothetical protein